MHHRCCALVVAVSAYQKHRISVVEERTSCAANRIWWLMNSLWCFFCFSLSNSSSLTSVFTMIGSGTFVELRKPLETWCNCAKVPELSRGWKSPTHTLVLAGRCLSKPSFRSISIVSDFFPSRRDTFPYDLRSHSFAQCLFHQWQVGLQWP